MERCAKLDNDAVPTDLDNVTISSATVNLSTSVVVDFLTLNSSTLNIGASISIAADQNTISSDSLVNAGTHTLTLLTKTAGWSIDLGGADSGASLALSDEELDRITADTLIVGDSASGLLNVSAAISHSNHLVLIQVVKLRSITRSRWKQIEI